MAEPLQLGMIGLDTSHVTAFAELLHNSAHPFHVPGGRVVVAYPGGSSDFALSRDRVAGFTAELTNQHGVTMVDSCRAVAERSDAILLESVDGRVHRQQFEEIVQMGKPIFVDKPFALTSRDAEAMLELAHRYGTPVFSCSALRYSEALAAAVEQAGDEPIVGADTSGPMALEPTQPGLFWYGIHTAEVLFSLLGQGCRSVTAVANAQHDAVVGAWDDGRLGTIRGNRAGNHRFTSVIHTPKQSLFVNISGCAKPFYASLLEQIMRLFSTRQPPIPPEETLRIVRFIEAANRSRETGQAVAL